HGPRAIELDPSFYPTRYFLALAYQANGDFEEAMDQLRQARSLSEGNSVMTGALAAALVAANKEDEATLLLQELDDLSETRYVSQTAIAAAYACKGEVNECLSRLGKAYDDHCLWLGFALHSDARFDGVRSEPRFQQLAQKVFEHTVSTETR